MSMWIDGIEIRNQGQLADAVGRENIVTDVPFCRDVCLCPVNKQDLAERLGCRMYSDGSQIFFFRDGDKYLWTCGNCGQEFFVDDVAHKDACMKESGHMSYSGPRYISGRAAAGEA